MASNGCSRGEKIYSADLNAAEQLAGLTVGAGDAIFVHSGIERRERAQGAEDPAVRPGLAAEAISWLSERDIAVYSGDCFEAIPSGYRDFSFPLHMIGLGAMGLVLLDNPSLTALLATCAELRSQRVPADVCATAHCRCHWFAGKPGRHFLIGQNGST